MNASTGLLWALTYFVHSTLLLGAVWCLTRTGMASAPRVREWLWRMALVGGVVSASIQTFTGVRPLTGSAELPAAIVALAGPASTSHASTSFTNAVEADRSAPGEASRRPRSSARRSPGAATGVPAVASAEPFVPARLLGPGGVLLATGLWLVIVALRTLLALGRRTPVTEGPWAVALDELARSASPRRRVRLTSSQRLAAPVALGVLRPEICVPARALEELPAELARPALAHELAHLVRLDPLWLGIAHVLRSLLLLQPLNRVAARELAHLAELCADDWAARKTGDRLALARCLTEFAARLQPADPPLGACAMVRRGGRLEERVRALLDVPRPERAPRAVGASAMAFLALSPFALPGWASTRVPAAIAPRVAPAAGARTWRVAADLASELESQIARVEERLAHLSGIDAPRVAPLLERSGDLRAELARVRADAADGGADADADGGAEDGPSEEPTHRSESPDDPGGQR